MNSFHKKKTPTWVFQRDLRLTETFYNIFIRRSYNAKLSHIGPKKAKFFPRITSPNQIFLNQRQDQTTAQLKNRMINKIPGEMTKQQNR